MAVDTRPTLENPDDDPYLWLEEIDDSAAVEWAEEQNSRTLHTFADQDFERDKAVLTEIFDSQDKIPFIRRRGDFVYNYWKDNVNPRGLWRRTTLQSFQTEAPAWEILLDLDGLSEKENEDWNWSTVTTLPGSHHRAILGLSRGGGDAVVLREFDLNTKSFVENGFYVPEAKGGASWFDENTLLLRSSYGQDMATECGYSRTVRLWRRGEAIEDAKVIFRIDAVNMVASAHTYNTENSKNICFQNYLGFFNTDISVGDEDGPHTVLDLPSETEVLIEFDWLVINNKNDWTLGEQTYKADCLLGIRLSEFISGNREFQILFEPEEKRALQSFSWIGENLVLFLLDNMSCVFEYWRVTNSAWEKHWTPEVPEISTADLVSLDMVESESNGDALSIIQAPLIPPTLSLVEPGKAPVVLKQKKAVFSTDGLTMKRLEATSVDGVKVPYTLVGPENPPSDVPVHMTAYGGFGLSIMPQYNESIGKIWLEQGGVSVVANIRGGLEFGVEWHNAGRYAGKSLCHDDFAAVADDLVKRGITSPGRIAAEGGSNGGLLITNMLTRYPRHFGALFCTIPLVDMRRYTKLLAGASWIDEYGDPDKPEEWEFIKKFSAYHNVKPDQPYPPILIATTRRDDRVHPGHARKMTAKLQKLGYPTHYYELETGGHSYGKDNAERAGFVALGFRFLKHGIGWNIQQ